MAPMQQKHFLVVCYAAQGHINPNLHLAKRLARTAGARATFSTTVCAHRRMFPSTDPAADDGLISYIPFSDGYDKGFKQSEDDHDGNDFLTKLRTVGSRTLSAIITDLADRGHPVTCIIYSILLPWVHDVARQHALPSALYWIQPATVFAIYYHYFHGHKALISAHASDPSFTLTLPGLPPLQIRDLPSFVTVTGEDPYPAIIDSMRQHLEKLDEDAEAGETPMVLVNTFEGLEPEALAGFDKLRLRAVPVAPLLALDDWSADGDLLKQEGEEYMEWLESKREGSVVYLSFGSFAVLKRRQVEEMLQGLAESGRPYLWALRKDSRWEGFDEEQQRGEMGMVVEWCSQLKVLSHRSVGCFVTHCGWNSTMESLACGMPMVGVPQWSDQLTNARLVEGQWGVGLRSEVDGEGLLGWRELARCLEAVMGEEERGVEIRRAAARWRDRARDAVRDGGSSDRNLEAFLQEFGSCPMHT